MQQYPLISICIPTYNRAPYLDQCLQSITQQFCDEDVSRSVEISLSDNASDDNTRSVVKKYAKYPNFKYSRNDSNIGFDRNMLKAVGNAGGEYCLLMGDDDILVADSLKYLIGCIREHADVDYFIFNSRPYSNERAATNFRFIDPGRTGFKELKDFLLNLRGMESVVDCFGRMSQHLFKKKIWDDFKDKDKYLDTGAVHAWILMNTMRNASFFYIDKVIIRNSLSTIRWNTFPGYDNAIKITRITRNGYLSIARIFGLRDRYFPVTAYFYKLMLVNIVRSYIAKFRIFMSPLKKMVMRLLSAK